MSLPLFEIFETWIGTGDTVQYDFSFKITQPQYLLVVALDENGNEQYRVRGTDTTTFLQSIEFDPVNGGGSITLLQDLPTNWVVGIWQANDWPTQPTDFPNKMTLSLSTLEQALDILGLPIQRLAGLMQRCLKIYDFDNTGAGQYSFNPTLPPNAAQNPGAGIFISSDGTTLAFGPTAAEIDLAEGYATDAAASQVAAAASAVAAAASAAQAAASSSGWTTYPKGNAHPYNNPMAITALAGITWDISSGASGRQMQYIQGSGGAVNISANPQISAGTNPGEELALCGTSDSDTVELTNGNGVLLNGNCILGDGDILWLTWDGNNWREMNRRIGAS